MLYSYWNSNCKLFLANDSTQKSADDLALSNIEALHASAAYMTCDQMNDAKCTIEYGGATGRSTGQLFLEGLSLQK